jgi:hypothetical protein
MTTLSSSNRPNKKALINKKVKNNINSRSGLVSNFLISFLVTINGKATTNIPNNKFGKALI